MSWLFSRALVEASLQDNCWAGDASARSNTMPTPQAFLLPDKTTGAWKRFPSGMTCEPLMAAHGAELLTFFRVVSLAKTSPAPEKASASAGSVPACGAKWRELSVKFDPDSCSWKTVRCLFPEDLDWSSLTLPDWGSLHDGELWERTTQALPTEGSESGCWPTPRASEAGPDFAKLDRSATGISLQTAVAMWPTPRAGNPGSRPNGKGGKILEEEVKIAEGLRERGQKMFPTPRAEDSQCTGAHRGNPDTLHSFTKMFPTPTANEDSYRLNGNSQQSNSLGAMMRREALNWPTPRTAGMCGGTGNWEQLKKNTTLEEARKMGAGNGGQLNPTWVEWLMGWPLGWTAFGASETDKCQQHTTWLGAFSRKG